MACASEIHRISSAAWFTAAHHAAAVPQLDHLMLFGFLSAFAAAACCIYRHESRNSMFAFAAALAAASVYGFLDGAWPMGILSAALALDATRQGLHIKSANPRRTQFRAGCLPTLNLETRQARFREVFGSN
jgi:hypothetical protein